MQPNGVIGCDKQNCQNWTDSQMSNLLKKWISEMKINVATKHVSQFRSVDDLVPLDDLSPQQQRQK